MCGIVGYSGFQNAKDIVIDGLTILEYRGYDSAGIAFGGERLSIFKTEGNVEKLTSLLPDIQSRCAIGHTRWATHGKPSAKNAHPHLSYDGKVAIVHNGVLDNEDELRAELSAQGIKFVSSTDSEIIAHLIAKKLENGEDMLSAVDGVGKRLKGAATFLAICEGDESIYARKKNASLSVGIGKGESFVASDTLAISKYTLLTAALDDDECAVLKGGDIKFFKDGIEIQKQAVRTKRMAPRPCACHMRAEIDETPLALLRTHSSILKDADEELLSMIKGASRLCLTGCGTAYHAALYGKLLFEKILSVPCEAIPASELDGAKAGIGTTAIFITQSGETADTLDAISLCKKRGAKTIAVTNVAGSAASQMADKTLLSDAGAEVAVAATKSYNCQLYTLFLLAKLSICEKDDEIDALYAAAKSALFLDLFEEKIKKGNLFFIGKGFDFVTAKEAALKFKEITCKMTDAYYAGELKHGPIALIDSKSTAIAIVTDISDKLRLKATISELRSRGAHTIALTAVGDLGADRTFELPRLGNKALYPIISSIPLQSLALAASLRLGLNPDRPRNLAKSVTVI